jgi:hypothetical protein
MHSVPFLIQLCRQQKREWQYFMAFYQTGPRVSRRYQLEQMKNKDKRTKLMNEIIGGVKVSLAPQ